MVEEYKNILVAVDGSEQAYDAFVKRLTQQN